MSPSNNISHNSRNPVLAVIGGINMDLVMEVHRAPDTGESMDALSLEQLHGGKGGNTAVAAHRASRPKPANEGYSERSTRSKIQNNYPVICMNGAVGDDAYGTELRAKLARSGIDTTGVKTIPNVSSNLCIVLVEIDSGDSRNVGYPAANLHWALSPSRSLATLGSGVIPDLIVTSLVVPREQVELVLEIAGEQGVDTLLNPSSPEYLVSKVYRHLTHLIMNETETAMLSGRLLEELNTEEVYKEAGRHFIDMGVKNVVITLGARGAFYITQKGESGLVPAENSVKVLDTTGAGDTFVGTYAVDYIEQKKLGRWNIRKAIERSCSAAARTTEQIGAQETIPWQDEIFRPRIG